MGEHATWFEFLNKLPGWQNLQHVSEHYLGRGEGTKYPWKGVMFGDTHFTLVPVLGMLLVVVILILMALAYRASVTKSGTSSRDAIVPPAKLNVRNIMEMFTDAVYGMAANVMGEKHARAFLPLIGSLAFVIFFCNVMGLIPGFVPPTDSLKVNVGMALVVFFATHIYGFKESGIGYLKHFLGPMLILAPLMLIIELISHIARPVSLSLRLMGNMAADHKVVAAFFGLIPLLVPVPFLLLGLLVCTIQTLVFCLLSMVYISMALAHDH